MIGEYTETLRREFRAVKWTGKNADELGDLVGHDIRVSRSDATAFFPTSRPGEPQSEEEHKVGVGTWVLVFDNGERRLVDDVTFQKAVAAKGFTRKRKPKPESEAKATTPAS